MLLCIPNIMEIHQVSFFILHGLQFHFKQSHFETRVISSSVITLLNFQQIFGWIYLYCDWPYVVFKYSMHLHKQIFYVHLFKYYLRFCDGSKQNKLYEQQSSSYFYRYHYYMCYYYTITCYIATIRPVALALQIKCTGLCITCPM